MNSATDAASRAGILFDDVNDGAPDDGSISKFAYSGELFGRGNSKADRDRKPGESANTLDQTARVGGHLLALASDSGPRDRIDKAGRDQQRSA